MKLLLGVLLVLYSGGFAGSSAWLFIGLTVFSWLYAPFLFNPFQFSKQYFLDDLRGWRAFFFSEGSRHWVAWYDRAQLKPRRGFRQSVWDIKAFLGVFVLCISFSILRLKTAVFWSIYSTPSRSGLEMFDTFTFYPPMLLSAMFCICLSLLEGGVARLLVAWRRQLAVKSARALGGSACEEQALGQSTSEGSAQQVSVLCRLPLACSSLVLVALEGVELLLPLAAMHAQGWYKAFIAGVIFKGVLLSLVLFMAEGVLRCRFFDTIGVLGRPLDLFVHANRLAKDLFVASFLFCTLAFGVLLNTLNDTLCPSFNLHQLLVYRARPLRPNVA